MLLTRYAGVIGLLGCLAGLIQAAPPEASHFEKVVRPILIEKCSGCHGPDQQKGGLRVDSRAALLQGGDSGPALVPDKPQESLLVRVLAHDGDLKMPPRNKLANAEIAAVTEWVRSGAVWPDSKNTTAGSREAKRILTPEERAFWAFQPVKRPAVPQLSQPNSSVLNEIDRFLLAKLQEQQLSFAPPADKRTLLRRVTLDLTGLPPTPEEYTAFLKDDSPHAYAAVIDRLLASPAYGEKWGRRWLDVARYADSNGMDENLAYVNAWRYRDWVIRSFNQDKPYNQFVREQIAGDLIGGGTAAEQAEGLIATGFLVVGPKMLAEDDPVKMQMDIIDEQLDTLGQAFLGLTIGCARCHDHKFDPITQADYYGLAGIFYSTKTMQNHKVVAAWNERPIGTAESTAVLAEYEKQLAAAKAAFQNADKQARQLAQTRLAAERQRVAEYVSTAQKLAKNRKPLELLVPDPGKSLPAGGLEFQAEAFVRGNVLKLTDGYGEGIGVIINAGTLPNSAEYEVDLKEPGTYQLAVRYAAQESRPVELLVNGKTIAGAICAGTTGSWFPDTQQWHAEAIIKLPKGKSVLRFERQGPFPHLDRFAMLPVPADLAGAATLSLEQLASETKLLPSVLQSWVKILKEHKGESLTAAEIETIVSSAESPFRYTPVVQRETQPDGGANLQKLRANRDELQQTKPPVDLAMAVEDVKGVNLRIHLRGNHLTLGAEVPRRFPEILSGEMTPSLVANQSGRRELAEWITRPDHPLTARVMVNRIWAGHFGHGLVRTTDNFGRLGERPSHPELLDWLAAEFVRQNWSIKALHRLILMSAAYQMSTQADPKILTTDPDNRLLSHFPRRRLDAEEIRDGMLAISGRLDQTMGGTILKATPRQYVTSTANRNYEGYSVPRRSVYLPVIRSAVYDVLQTLDFPDPSVTAGQRTSTTLPTQALFMMNGKLVDDCTEKLSRSLLDHSNSDMSRIEAAYQRILARSPTPTEIQKIEHYLQKSMANADPKQSETENRLQSWRGLCRVLFASNEFLFVE